MNIVFCSFLDTDVYYCIVVLFCCVYLYGMRPNSSGDDQVENGVRCDWEAFYIFHGLLMPYFYPEAPTPQWAGMLWSENEKTRKPPERVRVESNVIGMVIHLEYGGRNHLKF